MRIYTSYTCVVASLPNKYKKFTALEKRHTKVDYLLRHASLKCECNSEHCMDKIALIVPSLSTSEGT